MKNKNLDILHLFVPAEMGVPGAANPGDGLPLRAGAVHTGGRRLRRRRRRPRRWGPHPAPGSLSLPLTHCPLVLSTPAAYIVVCVAAAAAPAGGAPHGCGLAICHRCTAAPYHPV